MKRNDKIEIKTTTEKKQVIQYSDFNDDRMMTMMMMMIHIMIIR